ncbi:unnamed protein product [Dibothriocephalus latus]|uniref:Ricin B lectin domain-containing protein n=1 Tax=Dibothriocephalus latus TaxID=60516 RepID=A0A3P7PSX0_DIBLA|nr:unnamed protein product [Dibothriocephalus latus]
MRRDDYCADGGYDKKQIKLASCHSQGGMQLFEYTKDDQIKNQGYCLTLSEDKNRLTLESCNRSPSQKWIWSRKPYKPFKSKDTQN